MDIDNEYLQQLDRLKNISEKVCKALGHNLDFGFCSMQDGQDNVITVDYTIFKDLSDDAAAVLITRIITQISLQGSGCNGINGSGSATSILRIDRLTGKYLARTDFDNTSFSDLLQTQAKQNPRVREGWNRIREKAFSQGYETEQKQLKQRKGPTQLITE